MSQDPTATAARAPQTATSADLAALERGEISVAEYLERCVDRAIAPFRDKLTADQLETLREVMQEHVADDPVVAQTLRRLTARSVEE
jgi:hypothetical protein